MRNEERTFLVVRGECLVVLALQLGPLRELILRACSSELVLQPDHLTAQADHFLIVRGSGGGQLIVEIP